MTKAFFKISTSCLACLRRARPARTSGSRATSALPTSATSCACCQRLGCCGFPKPGARPWPCRPHRTCAVYQATLRSFWPSSQKKYTSFFCPPVFDHLSTTWVWDTVRRGARLKIGFATTRLAREANWRSRKRPWLLQHSRIGGVNRLGKVRRSVQTTSASLRFVSNRLRHGRLAAAGQAVVAPGIVGVQPRKRLVSAAQAVLGQVFRWAGTAPVKRWVGEAGARASSWNSLLLFIALGTPQSC